MPKTNFQAEINAAAHDPRNPLIVQSDRSLLLEVHNPLYEAARGAISPFAELEKSPEHIHTYRLTPISLWNAAATGLSAGEMCKALTQFAKYPVPQNVLADIADLAGRWGRVCLRKQDGELRLESEDAALLAEVARHKSVKPFLGPPLSPRAFQVPLQFRGSLKQALIAVGWPVEDLAGYVTGEALEITLRTERFTLRDYQEDAAKTFYFSGSERSGSGVVVLPCGAGKTIVGLTAMALVSQSTLILTTSRTSMQQWRRELLDKTSLQADQIVEYKSDEKQIGPVTLTTYQMLTWRPDKTEDFPHLRLFEARNWGLIIYDEVHMLPAPVYPQVDVIGAKNNSGAGGEDAIATQSGRVYVPSATESYAYDFDGNLTSDGRWTYVWDGENRLVSMTAIAAAPVEAKRKLEFTYDYQGRRIEKKVYDWNTGTSSYQLASTARFAYDRWNLIAELDVTGAANRTFVWGKDISGTIQEAGGIGGLLLINESSDSYQIGYDGIGNVTMIVKLATGMIAGSYEYNSFGDTLKSTGGYASQNPFKFSTKYFDSETSLLYFGYRFYNAQTGRWLGRDPIEEEGGDNLYTFVENNPNDLLDPYGLSAREWLTSKINDLIGKFKSQGIHRYEGKFVLRLLGDNGEVGAKFGVQGVCSVGSDRKCVNISVLDIGENRRPHQGPDGPS